MSQFLKKSLKLYLLQTEELYQYLFLTNNTFTLGLAFLIQLLIQYFLFRVLSDIILLRILLSVLFRLLLDRALSRLLSDRVLFRIPSLLQSPESHIPVQFLQWYGLLQNLWASSGSSVIGSSLGFFLLGYSLGQSSL